VSDGAIQMDRVAGRPGRLALAEVYACRP